VRGPVVLCDSDEDSSGRPLPRVLAGIVTESKMWESSIILALSWVDAPLLRRDAFGQRPRPGALVIIQLTCILEAEFLAWLRFEIEGNYQQLSGFGMGSIWVRSHVMLLILLDDVASFLCFLICCYFRYLLILSPANFCVIASLQNNLTSVSYNGTRSVVKRIS
jgi:hypothetical protein